MEVPGLLMTGGGQQSTALTASRPDPQNLKVCDLM